MSKDDKPTPENPQAEQELSNTPMPDENDAAMAMLLGEMNHEQEEEPPLEMQQEQRLDGNEEDEFAQAMALLQQDASQEGQPEQEVAQHQQEESDMPLSPTLEALDPSRRPQQRTVCERCPNSVWFASPAEVKCHCRVMYMYSWTTNEPNELTNCDGIWIGQEQ